jgi:hypothetical protein
MGRVGDILERFRPAGAPGSATIAGVPGDRIAELSAELGPVLALLTDMEAERVEVLRRADEEVARRRQAGAAQASQISADARQQSSAVRAEVAAEANREVQSESAVALDAAEQEAARIRRRAERLMPEYVRRVIATVRAMGDVSTVTANEMSRR